MKKTYFEVKVNYETFNEEGKTVKKSELYVLNANKFAEAESRILNELSHSNIFNLKIKTIKETNYIDIHTDSKISTRLLTPPWFKCQVNTVLVDPDTGKQTIDKHYRLVQAENTDLALKRTHELEEGQVLDYEIPSVSETAVVDVLIFADEEEGMFD